LKDVTQKQKIKEESFVRENATKKQLEPKFLNAKTQLARKE
jgi:hypothetical protein